LKHEIYWFHRATEEVVLLAGRNSKQATRILVTVREFGNIGRGDIKKLGGANEWRLRAGDWRIMLVLRADAAYVTEVSDRQDAY